MDQCATKIRITSLGRQLLTLKELMLEAQQTGKRGACLCCFQVIATFIEDSHAPATHVTQCLTSGQAVNDG